MDQIPVYFLLSLPLVGAFAMFALGIVVIYQASRVLNLAHGVMAMVPAYVAYEFSVRGVPAPFVLVLGVASGALIGVAIERVFVRGLRRQGPTGQTVGTVAALGLLLSLAIKIWGTTPRTGVAFFPDGGLHVGASVLRWGQIGLFGVAIVAALAFFALFKFTDVGLAMRGAADNRRAASLMGVDPDWTTSLAWALGGGLAALAGILLAAVTILHPVNLSLLVLPGFVAALIGGLGSLPGALAGAAVVGLAQGMVPAIGLIPGVGDFATQVGAPQLVLTIVALAVMARRGQRLSVAERSSDSMAPAPARAAAVTAAGGRRLSPAPRRALIAVLGAGLVAWPFLGAPFSFLGTAIQACIYVVIAVSLVMLTGWVGQISLAQATFVGVGAFSTALVSRRFGVSFPLSLPLSALIAGAAAALLGVVALRVRGLYLAVATLIFAWMADEYLFRSSWLVGAGGSSTLRESGINSPNVYPHFDFSDRRTFYFIALAVAAAALWGAANLRDSKTGRAFFAVRGSETAAASLGVDVTRYKLLAFAASGFVAGVAGNLLIVHSGSAVPAQFTVTVSLFFLSIAVVGGLRNLGGAVGAAVLFAGLQEVFFRVSALSGWLDVVSAGLLALVLVAYPGGLAAFPQSIARLKALFVRGEQAPVETVPAADVAAEPVAEASPARAPRLVALRRPELPADRGAWRSLLEVEGVTVRFGGLTAAEDVSLSVREGEIVGLIGPNGAGKTTIFNAVSGLAVPAAGRVRLHGGDVTDLPVHTRAALGVARTFQVIQLFSDLTVFDNLLAATHLRNPSGAGSHLFVTRGALEGEAAARDRVREVVELLDLADVADRPVAGLPFGVLRMVEVARALVTGAPLIMLDEPASGLDNRETDRLAHLLLFIRKERAVSMLLIEHDVRFVSAVSDYIYVIDRGRPLAEGTPREVQRDERVIAAYLGTEATGRTAKVASLADRRGADGRPRKPGSSAGLAAAAITITLPLR